MQVFDGGATALDHPTTCGYSQMEGSYEFKYFFLLNGNCVLKGRKQGKNTPKTEAGNKKKKGEREGLQNLPTNPASQQNTANFKELYSRKPEKEEETTNRKGSIQSACRPECHSGIQTIQEEQGCQKSQKTQDNISKGSIQPACHSGIQTIQEEQGCQKSQKTQDNIIQHTSLIVQQSQSHQNLKRGQGLTCT